MSSYFPALSRLLDLSEEYLKLVEKLKRVNPKIKFSSDFIIGYPGENENDFRDSLKLLKEVEFINTFSFIFSPRPGTPAFKMKKVNNIISKERLNIFQKKAEDIKLKYKKSLFNKKTFVLFENKMQNKKEFFGRDEYSNSVIINTSENLKGKIKEVLISGGNQNTLYGEINKNICAA